MVHFVISVVQVMEFMCVTMMHYWPSLQHAGGVTLAIITVQVGQSNTKDGPLCAVRHPVTFHQDGGFHSEQRTSILSASSALNQVNLHSGPQILDNLAFTFCKRHNH